MGRPGCLHKQQKGGGYRLKKTAVQISAYASSVRHSLVVLVIAFVMPFWLYLRCNQTKGEQRHGSYSKPLRQMLSSTFGALW